VPRDNFKS